MYCILNIINIPQAAMNMHKYRVPATAMPNPEKMKIAQKLKDYTQEAKMKRLGEHAKQQQQQQQGATNNDNNKSGQHGYTLMNTNTNTTSNRKTVSKKPRAEELKKLRDKLNNSNNSNG